MMNQMPNVPRDPNDPREKLKRYLEEKMRGQELMGDPEYRTAMRAPEAGLMDSNRDIGLADSLMKSAAQVGTIGGKTADTSAFSDYAKQLQGQNSGVMKSIQGERQNFQEEDDRALKIKQYLSDKMQGSEDKRLDREMLSKKMDAQLGQQRTANEFSRQRLEQGDRAIKLKESKPGLQLKPGQEAADKKYGGTKYLEWTGGDQAQFTNNQSLLNDALGKVQGLRDYWLNPRVDALLPDTIRPEATKVVQQDVSKAAIGAARAALGSQFTAQENFWVQRLSYDPGLSAEQNIQKIKRNLAEIEAIAADNDAMAAHYENNNGTISNYKSKRLKKASETQAADDYDNMSEEEIDRLLDEGAQ